MGRRFTQIAESLRQHGLGKTIGDIALRVLNRAVPIRVLKCIKIDTVNRDFLKCDGYRGMFVDDRLLRELSLAPEYEIPAEFLDEALRKGDDCYALFDGSTLASYGWYSNAPTETDIPELSIHFNERYVYMYKGFTHKSHRGKRLHAIGMTCAVESYLARGYSGIVSYVEWNNFASLKSCYRMGYRDFGTIYVIRAFNRYFVHCDRGCRALGFSLAPRKSETGKVPSAGRALRNGASPEDKRANSAANGERLSV